MGLLGGRHASPWPQATRTFATNNATMPNREVEKDNDGICKLKSFGFACRRAKFRFFGVFTAAPLPETL